MHHGDVPPHLLKGRRSASYTTLSYNRVEWIIYHIIQAFDLEHCLNRCQPRSVTNKCNFKFTRFRYPATSSVSVAEVVAQAIVQYSKASLCSWRVCSQHSACEVPATWKKRVTDWSSVASTDYSPISDWASLYYCNRCCRPNPIRRCVQ